MTSAQTSYPVYNKSITEKVQVEVIYETSPVFAGEDLIAIIRFKNKNDFSSSKEGINTEKSPEEHRDVGDENSINNNGMTFGRRISLQLSNTARSLFLDQLESIEEDEESTETLFLGYVQLFGYMIVNEDVIESQYFQESKKKSIIGGKVAGINDFDVSQLENYNSTLSNITSGIGSLLNSSINESLAESFTDSILFNHSPASKKNTKFNSSNNIIEMLNPIFSTNQTLLFSEITLKAGEIKSYYFKYKIPESLPPNFMGKAVFINYNLIVGCQSNSPSLQVPNQKVGNRMMKRSLYFPLRVFPSITEDGYQPITLSNISNLLILPKTESEVKALERSFNRRASFKTIEKTLEVKIKENNFNKQKLIEKLSQLINGEDVDMDMDMDSNNTSIAVSAQNQLNCREKIFLFVDNALKGSNSIIENKSMYINHELQLKKFQNQYTIKRNHKVIAKITITKPIFKIGEDINLIIDFLEQEVETSGIIISLESFENVFDEYSAYGNNEENDTTLNNDYINERTKTWYTESMNVLNHTKVNKLVNIPINITPQFQTRFFKLEWYIRFKFILLDAKHNLNNIFSVIDKNPKSGSLVVGMESLDGFDFNFKIPVVIIPTDQDLNVSI